MVPKILKWGLYFVALIPLIIFEDFLSPFHFGKVVVFRALVEIMAVLYLWLILSDRRYLPKANFFFWILTVFTVAFGITSLTSVNVYQSVMGTLERMGGWYTFLHFWVVYVIAASVLRTREDWISLIQVSLAASLTSTFYGFLQKTHWDFIVGGDGRARIFGTIGNTALFAGYTLINLFLALALLLRKHTALPDAFWKSLLVFIPMLILWGITSPPFFSGVIVFVFYFSLSVAVLYGVAYAVALGVGKRGPPFLPFFYGLVFVANIVAVFMTAVRGSIMGLLVSLGLFALWYAIHGTSRKVKVVFLAIALAAILFEGVLIAAHNTDFVRSSGYLTRLSDVNLKTRLIQTRFWAWGAGVDGWNDSIRTVVFGWGPENFNVPFSKHFNPKFFQGPGSETLFDRAHNMFVEVLVTMGLLGFVAYLAIFAGIARMVWGIWKRKDHEDKILAMVMACGMLAYMIHNSFIFDTSANFIAFFLLMGFLGFFFQNPDPILPKQPARPVSATLRYSLTFLLAIVVVVLIYRTDIQPARANYATTRAVLASWAGDHTQAVAKFREALTYDTFPEYEIRHRFAQYVLENYGKFKPDQGLNAGNILLEVIEHVKKNESYRLDYLPYLYVSRAYIILGKSDPESPFNELALQNSFAALEISPTFVRTYYEIAQAYLNQKDHPHAIETFRKAADLNPEVSLTWWYLGLTQVENGDFPGGSDSIQRALSLGYTMGENDYLRLIGIYAARKDFQTVSQLYMKLIAIAPNNPQYHASLATAYAQIGKTDEAVVEARVAAKLDPSFEPEAKQFVRSLGRVW